MVLGGQKIPLQRPRVRTREGQEVERYGQLQQNLKLQRAVQERIERTSSTKLRFGDACKFAVKDFQPFDQAGHFSVEQLRQAHVEAKRVAESVFENYAGADCIYHFDPAS